MSLIDTILNSYILEDSLGDDDNQNQENQPTNQNDNPDNQEGNNNADANDNQDAEQNEDNQDQDEYEMNDPETDDTDEQDDTGVDSDDPSQKLKDIEKSIFDQLTPEQQKTKTMELKNLYNETYEKCQSIINTISNIEKVPDQAKVYDYIVRNLVDLQKYIRDYLENLFDSKTYIENMTELQKYLAILDTINNVFGEMQKKAEADTKQ